jgi:hypothetical protein
LSIPNIKKKQKTLNIKILYAKRQDFGETMSGVCLIDENAVFGTFYPYM